ncbi:DUF4148 domain-containing protein [Methylibium sp.]|uniref:DUF4148 domain-containing protein n=1 Tax=Methylibium sp. TaxID=2067992 RepID=UPI003D0B0C97
METFTAPSPPKAATMKLTRITSMLFLFAALGTTAHAQAGKSREQVKAELAEAIRTGDIISSESGLTLREQYPANYPNRPAATGLTRAQVKAELAEAIRNGDIVSGDSSLKLNQLSPERYVKPRAPDADTARQAAAAASAPGTATR